MDRKPLKLMVISILIPLWFVSIYPFINIILRITKLSYPLEIPMYQIIRLITTTSLFAVSMLIFGLLDILEKQKRDPTQKKAFKIPLLLLLIWTIPLVSAYIFETNNQSMLLTILNLAALDEHFDDWHRWDTGVTAVIQNAGNGVD